VDINQPILLVCETDTAEESVMRLARIGYEKVLGYLEGGFEAWEKANYAEDEVESVSADELQQLMEENPEAILLDVRKESEFANSHMVGATHIPLAELQARRHDFEPDRKYIVYCGGGYRSMIAVSLLKIFGVDKPTNVHGGFAAIQNTEGISVAARTATI
ncbi:MAG: MBL fold metallo-hydrolase, partial [Verrucomicrobia bacterium]|nr:MBL fold metallo-hydrolase [Cytophagales bacterium]